jgi:hypothetical protein
MESMTTRSLSVSEVADSASAAMTCARRFWRTLLESVERVNAERFFLDNDDNSDMMGSITERSDVIAGRQGMGELRNDNS